jgi:hypothetical protein
MAGVGAVDNGKMLVRSCLYWASISFLRGLEEGNFDEVAGILDRGLRLAVEIQAQAGSKKVGRLVRLIISPILR